MFIKLIVYFDIYIEYLLLFSESFKVDKDFGMLMKC